MALTGVGALHIMRPVHTILCRYGAIAQLGERLHGMQEVSGSIPLSSTIFLSSTSLVPSFYFLTVQPIFCFYAADDASLPLTSKGNDKPAIGRFLVTGVSSRWANLPVAPATDWFSRNDGILKNHDARITATDAVLSEHGAVVYQ